MAGKPSGAATAVIALFGLVNLGLGGAHLLAPDGAPGWAGLAGATEGDPRLLWLFAYLGAAMAVLGAVQLAAATSYRPLVRPLLYLELARFIGLTVVQYHVKPVALDGAAAWGPALAVAVLTVAAVLEVRRTA